MAARKNCDNPDPRLQASILNKLFFCWIIPIFSYGRRNDLGQQDIPQVFPKDISEFLADKLERSWKREMSSALNQQRKPSFQKAIISTFGCAFVLLGIYTFFLLVVIKPLQTVFLGFLIRYFASDTSSTTSDAYFYASILIITTLLESTIFCHTLFQARQLGMRLRIASSSLIYRKMMRLSCTSANRASGGLIINLLSNDVAKFDILFNFLHYLWVLPFQVVVIAYLMWSSMGVASLIGIAVLSLETIPIEVYFGKLIHTLRKKVTERTDRRVLLINEVISGIRVIKMYTWEPFFQQLSCIARRNEVNVLAIVNYLKGASSASYHYVQRAALFITILIYVMQNKNITADTIFMMFQFYAAIQQTMSIGFPQGLYYYAETIVSINRIQNFLLLDEVKNTVEKSEDDASIVISRVNASWIQDSITYTLNNITISIANKSLFVITGSVGAGKSSFLKLILGELQPKSGQVSVGGNTSYASQDPWLFAASIRENILFGEPYDQDKYNRVIQACCLLEDFKQLKHGDKKLVGDKGAALSGGQCARVNLARTIYRDADIYLLDDPFSALDTHVSKRLFEHCVNGYLKDKTRIIVTHHEQFLEKADTIVYFEKGNIEFQGDLKALKKFGHSTIFKKETSEKPLIENIVLNNDAPADEPLDLPVLDMEENLDELKATEELLVKEKMKKSLYWKYFKACGSYALLLTTLVSYITAQLLISGSDYWIAYWVGQEETKLKFFTANQANKENVTLINIENLLHEKNSTTKLVEEKNEYINKYLGLIIYGALILGTVIMATGRNLLLLKICKNASYNIHNLMINSVLKAPMKFFDINPSGRILNRFSKDLGATDEVLSFSMSECFQRFSLVIGILIQILIINWWIIFPMFIMIILQLKIKNVYLATAQKVKRLESNAKSPVLSLANSSLSGLLTIRSCQAEATVCKEFDSRQDAHTRSYSLTVSTVTAFGFWLDLISIGFISTVIYRFILLDKGDTSDEKVGLAITQALGICNTLQYAMKLAGEIVSQMIGVERLFQFTKLEQEGSLNNVPVKEPPRDWPTKGEIVFDHLYLKYTDDMAPILKDLNIKVDPGMKVGIVGRTGAGKSSLISALLNLAKTEGRLYIDDLDTSEISLRDLRSNICVIPQEPVLFSVPLRENLDPLHKADDTTIWSALQDVDLKKRFFSLEQLVNQNDMSTGQRQLLCLARAIIKKSKVLVLDEATANIDPDTDALIQKTIRIHFKDCTVLTIAHRLNTIMDSDKVLVMSHGEAVEFDHPHVLLQDDNGYFSKMMRQVDRTGLII